MVDAPLLLDALLVASAGGTAVLLAAGAAVHRMRQSSNHVRFQTLACALGSAVVIFAVTVAVRPGPVGCLSAACRSAPAENAGQSQRHYMFAAMGKFQDIPAEGVAAGSGRAAPGWIRLALLTWGVGFVFVLAGIVRRHLRVFRLVREAAPLGDGPLSAALARARSRTGHRPAVALLRHEDIAVPVVGGSVRPVMFLPPGFESRSGAEIDMVILHELAHLRRRDPLSTLLMELCAACFWFNPLVWKTGRRVRELQELAADSCVLDAGIPPSRYAQCLLDTFRDLAGGRPAVPNAHSILGDCLVETRLRTILDPGRSHRVPSLARSIGIAAAFVAVSIGVAVAPASLQAMGVLSQDRRSSDLQIQHALLNQDALDSVLRPVFINVMADRYVAGASVAIVHDGTVVYRAAFGRQEVFQEVPVDAARTIFRIGSITKVMTGVAVMQLVERGLLDLDADVNDYLTDFTVPATFDEPVRIRHLLTHTAGFDQTGLGRHAARAEDVRPLGAFLRENLIRIRPPGQVSSYDTYAITLAGYLVQELSGMPYEEYLQQHIFQPLRMYRSGITVPPALAPDVAVGYEFAGHWSPQRWEFMNTDPASTVNATATDMANFAIMMLQGGEFEGKRILSAASVRAMMTRQYTNHPDHPGYGYTFWEDPSHGVPAFSHGGSMTGYASFLYLVPEFHLGLYITYNQESGGLANAVIAQTMAALFPNRTAARALRPRWEQPSDLSRFTGTYANNMYHHTNPMTGWRRRPFDISAEGDALLFEGVPAYRVGELDFQRDDGVLLSFQTDERGEIIYLFVNQAAYERLRS